EFKKVGELIVETLDGLAKNGDEANTAVEESVKTRVHELTRRFPIYG
ncbi:MAG: glyA, partial [Microvirga sp.]|nr:glyA [Microvirga sp.]